MRTTDEYKVWIALCELCSLKDRNEGCAFCTAMAFVRDKEHFEQLARETLAEMGFRLIAIEEVEGYDQRAIAFQVSDECRTLADRTTASQPIHFCRFHTFPYEG